MAHISVNEVPREPLTPENGQLGGEPELQAANPCTKCSKIHVTGSCRLCLFDDCNVKPT